MELEEPLKARSIPPTKQTRNKTAAAADAAEISTMLELFGASSHRAARLSSRSRIPLQVSVPAIARSTGGLLVFLATEATGRRGRPSESVPTFPRPAGGRLARLSRRADVRTSISDCISRQRTSCRGHAVVEVVHFLAGRANSGMLIGDVSGRTF